MVDQLSRANDRAPDDERITVVMRYPRAGDVNLNEGVQTSQVDAQQPVGNGDETAFEDAFRLARAMTSDKLRKVRVVSWVQGEITGHSTLPIIASDLLLVGSSAVIADATAGENSPDETLQPNYLAIARRRGLFPPAVVSALIDPSLELAAVTKVGGERSFASGDDLAGLRSEGTLLGEDVASRPGDALRLNTKQLRESRIAAGVADSIDEVLQRLDLAKLTTLDDPRLSGTAKGALLEITGSIAPTRSRRWQSNLTSTLTSDDVNTWIISIDSIGGSLGSSATLAGWFAERPSPLQQVAGFVRGEARGDSSLIALACKPLIMKSNATIGGQGAETIAPQDVAAYDELISLIGKKTNRPAALIRGLLDIELEVFRYTNRKTGRIRYATSDDILAEIEASDDPESEKAKWQRGERIELAEGLTATEAIALGLADDQAESIDAASRQVGLPGTPPPVAERGLVRLVERLGRSTGLSFLLLFIGFSALSAEANAPGLSFPGFIALICFALFFWMKFLAGTAEWLELLALSLGLICIAIEIFVVPGFGVFGIGGLALTVLGIVLMSQTFVVPQSVYQITLFTKGVWAALGGAAGMIGGFILMRLLFPHLPFFNKLVMEAPDSELLEESEKLGDYSHLMGRTGVSTTPLRPSGKARFDDQIIQVLSDGTAISAGEAVRVCEVHATKVIVESVN